MAAVDATVAGESQVPVVSRLLYPCLSAQRGECHLVLNFVENEERDFPLTSIFVPGRPLAQLVLVALVQHYLHDALGKLNVLLLSSHDLQQLLFIAVGFLGELLYLL